MIQPGKHTSRLWRRLGLLAASLLFSGCETFPQQPIERHDRAPAPWQAVFDAQLARQPGGQRVQLANSPWGRNRAALLHPIYSAASGRRCRRLTLSPEQDPRMVLACQRTQTAHWEPVRLLHHDGRAILTALAAPQRPDWTP